MSNARYNSVLLVPIEPQPYRYSAQWLDWFTGALDRHDADAFDWRLLDHKRGAEYDPPEGQFLDAVTTNEYKGRQIEKLARLLPQMEGPTLVFFLDLWHPGVVSVAYMRDALDLDLDIKGILHAGTYDPWDFLAHKGMGDWARGFEASVLRATDEVMVGSTFHKDLVRDTFDAVLSGDTVSVHGLPVYTDEERRRQTTDRLVCFPHREAVEKAHDTYREIRRLYRKRYPQDDADFVRTVDLYDEGMSPREKKERYYDVLSVSRVALSTARQETFGIAMQEARNLGAVPIAPNRLSYRDVLPASNRYDSLGQAVRLLRKALDGDLGPSAVRFPPQRAASILRYALTDRS